MAGEDLRDLPLPELLRRLADQTATLVRQEIELARAELAAKGKVYGASAGAFGAAALLGLGAFGALTATIIILLALLLPLWAAALIVTIVYAIIAFVLFRRGRTVLRGTTPIPTQATETTKEDIEWVKTRAKSGRK
jgi:tetrahydromethanopterin S-methyltransferase subunit C